MVRRLMHTTQKVNEELEVLQRLHQQRIVRPIRDRRERVGGNVGQERTGVLYGVEDDVAIATHPAVRAGELAIVDAFGDVQYGPGSACIGGPGGRHKVRLPLKGAELSPTLSLTRGVCTKRVFFPSWFIGPASVSTESYLPVPRTYVRYSAF